MFQGYHFASKVSFCYETEHEKTKRYRVRHYIFSEIWFNSYISINYRIKNVSRKDDKAYFQFFKSK